MSFSRRLDGLNGFVTVSRFQQFCTYIDVNFTCKNEYFTSENDRSHRTAAAAARRQRHSWSKDAHRTEQNLGLGGSPVGGGVTAGAAAARRRHHDWSRDAHRTEQGHARRTEPRRACSWSWAWSPARCRSTPCARELAAACVQAGRNGRNLLLTLASGTYIRPKFLSIARQLSRYSIPFPPAAPAPSIWAAAIT